MFVLPYLVGDMKFVVKNIFFFVLLFLLFACGDKGDGKVSKGHRDAIKIECNDDPDKKLCGLEVRQRFLEEGNDFVTFDDLNKAQIKRVKLECIRSKKYGLEAYNNCLGEYKQAALDGTITQIKIAKKPTSNIESLEKSVVYVTIIEMIDKKGKDFKGHGSGSGVILNKKLIATNCHVALVSEKGPNRDIWINNVHDEKKWAIATIHKKNVSKDICLLKHRPVEQLNLEMTPVRGLKKFSKLKKGDFVRAMGNPGGLIAHTAQGSIQYLGTIKDLIPMFGENITKVYDEDTKIIVHGAKIHKGSSGGPLFDKDGKIIGLNTLGATDSAAESIAISADYIIDLLKN